MVKHGKTLHFCCWTAAGSLHLLEVAGVWGRHERVSAAFPLEVRIWLSGIWVDDYTDEWWMEMRSKRIQKIYTQISNLWELDSTWCSFWGDCAHLDILQKRFSTIGRKVFLPKHGPGMCRSPAEVADRLGYLIPGATADAWLARAYDNGSLRLWLQAPNDCQIIRDLNPIFPWISVSTSVTWRLSSSPEPHPHPHPRPRKGSFLQNCGKLSFYLTRPGWCIGAGRQLGAAGCQRAWPGPAWCWWMQVGLGDFRWGCGPNKWSDQETLWARENTVMKDWLVDIDIGGCFDSPA